MAVPMISKMSDGTVYMTGRTSDGTKLMKIIASTKFPGAVGKYVDSTNLNKMSTGASPTYYGNSLGISSWQASQTSDAESVALYNQMVQSGVIKGTTSAPAPAQTTTPTTTTPSTPPPTGTGNYGVQSTGGSTSSGSVSSDPQFQLALAQMKLSEAMAKFNPMDQSSIAALAQAQLEYTIAHQTVAQTGGGQPTQNDTDVAAWLGQAQQNQSNPAPPPTSQDYSTQPGVPSQVAGDQPPPQQMTPVQMAAKIFPNDTRAQQAFVNAWNEGLVYEQQGMRSREATERAALIAGNTAMNNPLGWLNDFLTSNPVGQVLAPVLEYGASVTTGAGPGASTGTTVQPGMNPSTPAPADQDWDSIIDQAVNNYNPPPSTINGGTNNSGTMTNNGPVLDNPSGSSAVGGAVGGAVVGAGGTGTTQTGTTSTGGTGTTGSTGTGTGGVTPEALLGIPGLTPELTAILLSGGGSALATYLAAQTQADAANQAAQTQADYQQQALQAQKDSLDKILAAQKDQYDQQRADWEPWRAAGEAAIPQLQTFYDTNPAFGMDQFQADPGYSFRLSEGMKAIQNSAAAKGGLLSGNTLKAINNYGQEAASQEYNNAYNRYNSERQARLNHLQSLAGMNQTAIQQTGNAGANYANNVGGANQTYANNASSAYGNIGNALAGGIAGQGNAQASGWMGGANALAGTMNNLNNWLTTQKTQNYLNSLL